MTLTSLVLILLLGLLLIAVEIVFIPGTTIVGVLGALLSVLSIGLGFYYLSSLQAWLFTGSAVGISAGLGIMGLRSKTWTRFEVKSTIESKSPSQSAEIQVGMPGITTSRCNPIGQAEISNKLHEVYAIGDYLESGTPILVERIENQYIYIKSNS
jgi:membrane-bound ClpP family serine protease